MQRFINAIVLFLFCCSGVTAQSGSIDKSRVMEYFQNQQFEEAMGYLRPFLHTDSNNLQLLGFAGYGEYMNDNPSTALTIFNKMYALDSTNIYALQYLAKINMGISLDTTKGFFYKLIVLQPGKALYYRNLGEIYKRENEKDSALNYFLKARTLAPEDKKNIAALAEVCIDLKKFSSADSLLDEGLAKDSLHVPFLKLRLRSAYEAKDYSRAILLGEKLIRLDAQFINSLIQLTFSYYNLQQYPDCIRICEYMSQRQMGSETVLYYEARAWAKLKNYAASDSLLETCAKLAISKTAELYYYTLAENSEYEHKYARSVSMYDTAFYLFKNPLMLYNCGRLYESRMNNLKMADKYYNRFLFVADPDAADQKAAYVYVKKRKVARKTVAAKK